MSKKFSDNFNYEGAREDLFDMGLDPDYLSYSDPAKRDEFMREAGLDPHRYGSKWGLPEKKPTSIWGDYMDEDEDGENEDEEGLLSDVCYLTTACTVAKGLPDDCEELSLLRAFRDGYLRGTEGGEAEIAEYYAIAPGIVRAVNARTDAAEIWERLYSGLVLPCVAGIKAKDWEGVHQLYRSTTLKLKEEYLGARR